MGALPVISASLGVVGAITGISSRRAEERRQTDLVNAQLMANQQSEALKYQNVTAQRQFLYQNYVTQNMQRLQEFRQAESQFRLSALENQTQASGIAAQTAQQRSAAELAAGQAQEQILSRTNDYENQAASQMYSALSQQANTDQAASQALMQVDAALKQGDSELAGYLGGLIANSGGSRASNSDTASAEGESTRQLAQMLSTLQNAQNASGVELQNIIQSEDFSRLLDSVNQLEVGSANESVNRQLSEALGTTNANARINDLSFNTNAEALGRSLQMVPVNAQISQNQADLNFLTGNVAIGSEAGQIAAQSLSNNAQLLRSLPPKTSFLSDATSVLSAASPLLAYAAPRPINSLSQNPISNFKPVIYDVRPTLNTEFYA